VPSIGAVLAVVVGGRRDRLDSRRIVGLAVGFVGVAALVGLDVRADDLGAIGQVALVTVGSSVRTSSMSNGACAVTLSTLPATAGIDGLSAAVLIDFRELEVAAREPRAARSRAHRRPASSRIARRA